jgi:two-component system OmpR family sensor kinase
LAEALALRKRLVTDAGHELRAPLTRLHIRAQLLARRLRPGESVRPEVLDEVDRLVQGTGRLGELLEDVLRSAELAGRRRLALPVDLAVLTAELAEQEQVRARTRGVSIEVRRLDTGACTVRGTAAALRRVISALLDNALRHTGAGGHIRITLSGGRDGTVEMAVCDDGTGLDPATADRLFTRFVGDGSGLGLALAREIVEAHGGTITASGRPGAGAAFTVRLPAADTPPAPRGRARTATRAGHPVS